jgi:hypothetical protein
MFQMGYGKNFRGLFSGDGGAQTNDNDRSAVPSAPASAILPGNPTTVRRGRMQGFPGKQELHEAFTQNADVAEYGYDGELFLWIFLGKKNLRGHRPSNSPFIPLVTPTKPVSLPYLTFSLLLISSPLFFFLQNHFHQAPTASYTLSNPKIQPRCI